MLYFWKLYIWSLTQVQMKNEIHLVKEKNFSQYKYIIQHRKPPQIPTFKQWSNKNVEKLLAMKYSVPELLFYGNTVLLQWLGARLDECLLGCWPRYQTDVEESLAMPGKVRVRLEHWFGISKDETSYFLCWANVGLTLPLCWRQANLDVTEKNISHRSQRRRLG